jgi:hypothetical protein
MLAGELPFALLRIARFLGVGVLLTRIAMLAARAPVTVPGLAGWRRSAVAARARPPLALLAAGPAAVELVPRSLWRIPQLAAGEPPHLGVRVLLAQPGERRQQLVTFGRPKGRRQPARDDRPVGITWRH